MSSSFTTMMTDTSKKNENIIDTTLMGEIEPGLWVGGLGAVKEIRKRPDRPWTVISVIHSEKLSLFVSQTIQELTTSTHNMAIRHIEWDIADKSQSELLCPRLEEIMAAMDERLLPSNDDTNRGYWLVHCAFGISRSVAICAAWLMARRQQPLCRALPQIRAVRPDAAPNIGFVASLRALEQCEGNITAAMERMASRRTKPAATVVATTTTK